MKCKDIPDRPILEFLVSLNGRWANWFWYEGIESNPGNTVRLAMPDGPNLPDKLVMAKMSKLMRRGLVDGCDCGCRGDFEITQKGMLFLESSGK